MNKWVACVGLLLSVGLAMGETSSPKTYNPEPLQKLNSSGKFVQPTSQVYEVAADGSREYSTIQAALKAATNGSVDKIILIYPGNYVIADDTQISMDVAKTHLVGISRDSVWIRGAVPQLKNGYGGFVRLAAANCSLENLSITNTARIGNKLPYHGNVVNVGNHPGGTDASNCRIDNCYLEAISETQPKEGGHDTVYVVKTGYNLHITNSTLKGDLDVISFLSTGLIVRDCLVDCRTTGGGQAFWTGHYPEVGVEVPTATFINVQTRNAYDYITFNGGGDVKLINVQETVRMGADMPDFFIATAGSKGNLWVSNCYGKMPATTEKVVTTLVPASPNNRENPVDSSLKGQQLLTAGSKNVVVSAPGLTSSKDIVVMGYSGSSAGGSLPYSEELKPGAGFKIKVDIAPSSDTNINWVIIH